MSDKAGIDLDAIEARAKARGWRFQRTKEHLGGYEYAKTINAWTPEGRIWADETGEWGGDDAASERHEAIITAPRWTLADIVASPPEGWTAKYDGERAEFYAEGIAVYFGGPQLPWASVDDADPITLAKRHRAVAELLVLLGEVES